MSTRQAAAPTTTPVGGRGLIACLSFAALTGSVVAGLGNPIIVEVSVERDVSLAAAQWTLIITLLVAVVATPVVSRIADGRLRRQALVAALAIVALGSLIGAVVPTFAGLLTGRALQGLGYAMVPLTVSIAREWLSGSVLDRTLGVLSTSIAVGVGLGNPVMGLCVLLVDYRLAFVVAFLVSTGGAVWVLRRVPPAGPGTRRVRIDLLGAALLGAGLAGTLLAVARGDAWGWTSPTALTSASAGVVLLALWVLRSLRTPAPLIDLRLACSRGVLGVNLAATLLGVCVFGGAAAVILLVQRPPGDGVGFGYSVFVTGLLMTPMAVATLFSPPLARAIARRVGERVVLPLGSAVSAVAFGTFALMHDRTWHVVLTMALMGVGIGIAYSVMPVLIVARTPAERTASATGVNQVLRLLGGSVGAAGVAAVLAAHTPVGGQPAESGYVVAVLAVGSVGLLSAVAGWVLVPSAQPPGHRERGEQDPLFVDS
ncbi:MFS transporter [Blastococcus sp. CT_GayMR20]|uniref:MFS transporter n=1 Tax=Blastococcus sp. CT_GayMR20 TaxID=2559609 RepID=UPI0010747A49|nr:MFS transporter [Blastococcus sp. CT_GayMR20]TFV78137.1 MFS transporter [Blastococcus sp. CT_GayMR20]